MSSSESPFTDLDVYADWSGDPTDNAEVKIVFEVRCVPYLDIPIFSTRLPAQAIQKYSIAPATPANAGPTFSNVDYNNLAGDPPDFEELVTTSPSTVLHSGNSSAERSSASPPDVFAEYPKDDSSIIIPDSPGDDFNGAIIIQTSLKDDQPTDTPLASPIPFTKSAIENLHQKFKHARKRSAKEASLPDSISDSERPYGGFKQTKEEIKIAGQHKKVSSESAKSRRFSLIPRPVNAAQANMLRQSGNSPVPRLLGSGKKLEGAGLRPAFGPLKEASHLDGAKLKKEDTQKDTPGSSENLKKSVLLELPSPGLLKVPVTPTKSNMGTIHAEETELEDVKSEISDDNISTVASCATPRDIQDILDSYAVDEWVEHTEVPPAIHTHPESQSQTWFNTSSEPRILYEDGFLSIVCPPKLRPGIFQATVVLHLALEKSYPRGWLNFVVRGLPRLRNDDTMGYIYFWTPPGQGLEVRTMHLKRYTIADSCMMGQFLMSENLVIPVRPCDGQFYGFLKDFQVKQSIRADVISDEGDISIVKYHAICNINLIQRSFWAEKCGMTLYIDGGPDGDFSCHLSDPGDRTQTIHLNSPPDGRTGISELQIVCSPRMLNLFGITWEARVRRGRGPVWMPRIRSVMETDGSLINMQFRYVQAEEEGLSEVVRVSPHSTPNPLELFRSRMEQVIETPESTEMDEMNEVNEMTEIAEVPESRWKGIKWILFSILLGLVLSRFGLHVYSPDSPFGLFKSASNTASVQASVVTLDVSTVLGPENKSPESTSTMPFRDRIDYSLGWRGPLLEFRGQPVRM